MGEGWNARHKTTTHYLRKHTHKLASLKDTKMLNIRNVDDYTGHMLRS